MESEWRVAAKHITENESGNQVMIIEWQQFLIFTDNLGNDKEYKKSLRWTLIDGTSAVNRIDENTFQIFQTDEILRKI